MERISRSFDMVGLSYRILLRDKELMVLPLISGIVTIAVAVSVAFGFGLRPSAVRNGGFDVYLPLFLMYVVAYTVGLFFQAAVVAGATERMRGGNPTVASALAAAARRSGAIVAWAIVAATVGTVIRVIHDRVGVLGRFIAAAFGAAWSLATLFIVPVLVLEEKSVQDSFRRSTTVFKETWGESVTGGVTLGLAAMFVWLPLVVVALIIGVTLGQFIGIGFFMAGAIFLSAFFSTLQGIYLATLYRYATDGWVPAGFEGALLQQAFVSKDGTNHVTLDLNRRSS